MKGGREGKERGTVYKEGGKDETTREIRLRKTGKGREKHEGKQGVKEEGGSMERRRKEGDREREGETNKK